jgi:hypothetical protein
MLRKGLAGGIESGESSFDERVRPTPDQPPNRFEHYELVMGEDKKPVELGRGAMGVTYKAFDVDVHCPVTLKVISERYLGDESARLRFLRDDSGLLPAMGRVVPFASRCPFMREVKCESGRAHCVRCRR